MAKSDAELGATMKAVGIASERRAACAHGREVRRDEVQRRGLRAAAAGARRCGARRAARQGYPKIPGQQVGPALFPGLIAVGLCVCGAMLLVRGWRERQAVAWVRPGTTGCASPRHLLRPLLVLLGSVVFYIVASERLGFLPTASIILLACSWCCACRRAARC
jgi:hypothetical protein